MRCVATQVYNLNSSTDCNMVLKKKPDTHISAPSLLRMHVILLQIALARDKLFTTASQSSSAADITRPSYLKEVTISNGRS